MKTAIFTYPGDVFTFPGKIENFHISRRHVFTYTVDEFFQIFTFTGATFSHIPAKIFTYPGVFTYPGEQTDEKCD